MPTQPASTAEKLDRIDCKIDSLIESTTRLIEQGNHRQRAIDDHEIRLRTVEDTVKALSASLGKLSDRIGMMIGILAFIAVTTGGYLLTLALKVIFP